MSPRRKKLLIAGTTLVLGALLAWFATIVVRTHTLYDASKGGARGWRGSIYRSDAELGLAPIPGARADEVLEPLPDVPSRIGSRGFRIPLDAADPEPLVRPLFLALGCSITFGSCVRAEEAFAHRVARRLGGTCLNAGLCSGGVAQQLQLARRLIPEYAPDYVLLQCSIWLIERSQKQYASSFAGRIPIPYFVASPTGLRIQAPVFEPEVFDLPIDGYRSTDRGLGDFLGFLGGVGIPLLAHDDVLGAWTSLRGALGDLPPVASAEEIEASVYPEIAKLCADHGARLVVVVIENRWELWSEPDSIRALGLPIAWGTKRMRDQLSEQSPRAYKLAYLHVAGEPPDLIDPHPNARAHAVIAEEIVDVLQRTE